VEQRVQLDGTRGGDALSAGGAEGG
jgi:hypothetical protein